MLRRIGLGLIALVLIGVAGFAGAIGVGLLEPDDLDPREVAGKLGVGEPDEKAPEPPPPPEPDPAPLVLSPPGEAADGPDGKGAKEGTAPIQPTKKGLTTALSEAIADGGLGPSAGISVRDLATGEVLYGDGAGKPYVPASTTKLFTAAAALSAYGPDHRFSTWVTMGANEGEIVLVGGGDPLLATKASRERLQDAVPDRRFPAPATIDDLAELAAGELAEAGIDRVRVLVDDTRFTEPIAPTWESQYVPTSVAARVTALSVDQARISWPYRSPRAEDPAMHAAGVFTTVLAEHGITVEGEPERGTAPPAAEPIASVRSPRLAEIVELCLLISENDVAEVLAKQVAVAGNEEPTFDGSSKAVRRELKRLGVDMSKVELHDGSGLSRSNRIPPNSLTKLLSVAAADGHPELRPLLASLPVGGFNGTLGTRYIDGPGTGVVRAKTGTLTGVSSLAGLVTTADGAQLAFAVVTDGGAPIDPRLAIDRVASTLAACGCAS